MCGIVGYAGFKKRISLDRAIVSIAHRGPDDRGSEYFKGVALGNTRLAIIDLSPKGHQPMFNQTKSLCIVFNGEIYNYRELKLLLEKKYKFVSQSDTEVVLYAFQEWGAKCLEKLEGMFAFVIYDLKNKSLFGARDRLGQKPLKYYYDKEKVIFASEIKAILTLLGHVPEIDKCAIDNYLTLQYVPSPQTGFKDIYKLSPGSYFIYKHGKLTTHRYWSLNFENKLTLSKEKWIEKIYASLAESVKSHLISDVTVGALLSGGLDSSIVVALMSKNAKKEIHTFSIGFKENKFDESQYSKQVADLYHTKHTTLNVTSDDLKRNIEKIVEHYGEPIGDNSILPTMLVSKLAGSDVKVALTGDGGDENFAGYGRYTIVRILEIFQHVPHSIKKILKYLSTLIYKIKKTKSTEFFMRIMGDLEKDFFRQYVNLNCFFTTKVKQKLYTPDFKKNVATNDTYDIYRKIINSNTDYLDNALKIDVETYLPHDLLYKTDIASMAYSLELRAPFLDHKLMELTTKMPSEFKLDLGTKKKILKEMAIKYNLLPEKLVNRSKRGFIIPLNKWFKGSLKNYVTNSILSSCAMGLIFDRVQVESYLKDYFSSDLNYDNNIFSLLMLCLWTDRYYKK